MVHRLDRDTSGLLVFARGAEAADALREQFRAHSVERIYLAIVSGNVRADSGTFDSFLSTNRALDRYSSDSRRGERAITHYRVRERLAGATFVEVRLETGRRNQIRVHFAEAGHPVLGDRRYGTSSAGPRNWPSDRLALHAAGLGFTHPASGERLTYAAPLPAAFRKLLAGDDSTRGR